jgi:hypothetical protein
MRGILILSSIAVAALLISTIAAAGSGPDSLWMRAYGRGILDQGRCVQDLSGGGYIVVGVTHAPPGDPDVYILRVGSGGDTLWTRQYGWALSDEADEVRETSDGNYIVAGKTQAVLDSTYYMLLMEIAPDGDTLWTRTYGQGYRASYGLSVEEVSSGGYIVAGGADPGPLSSAELFLVRTDTDGDTLWTRLHGTASQEEAWSVQETFDGGFVAAGTKSQDVYLVRTDANGDTLWTRQYGGPSSETGLSVQQTPDSGYVIAGSTWSFGAGKSDAYFVRTDRSGGVIWTRTYGGQERDQASSIVVTSDNHFVAGGSTESFGVAGDMWLLRLDAAGDTVWTATYGGLGEDRAHWVEETMDGGYILTGATNSFGPLGHSVYLVKTTGDPAGVDPLNELSDRPGRLWVGPSPCRKGVHVEYEISKPQMVRVAVYSLLGKEVNSLSDGHDPAGLHRIYWDGCDRYGRPAPPGLYFVRLETHHSVVTRKVVFIR